MVFSAIQLLFEIILAPLLLTLIAPQMIAAFYAKSVGRSFWFWISLIIPIISIAILMCLPDKADVIAVTANH